MPLLTYFDDASGERTVLTADELGDWAAATAALLTAGCGLGPGNRVAVRLPPHWQTAAVLLGAWAAGIEVSWQGWATAGLGGPLPEVDAAFVSVERARSFLEDPVDARHRFVLGLAPHGGPTPSVPDGYRDYLASIRPFADASPPRVRITADDAATVDGTTYGEWSATAAAVAAALGIRPRDRVLVDVTRFSEPVQWLLAPLSAGASVILCANLDPAHLVALVEAESATKVL